MIGMSLANGPIVLNPVAGAALAALTNGSPDYANNHGMILRNGPIGATDNTVNIGFAFSGSATVQAWLKPGEAFSFAPADAADTGKVFIISADGSNATCWLEVPA